MKQSAGTMLVLLLASVPAGASESELPGSFGGSVNPAGLQITLGAGRRWDLYDSRHPLLEDARFSLRLTNRLNPSYNRLEASLELSPLSVLDLKAAAELIGYFGNFGHLTGFEGYDDDFSRDVRSARSGESVSGVARRIALSPALKLRAGRLSFRAAADFEWWALDHSAPFFYEPSRGTLLRSGEDSLVAVSALVLLRTARHADRGVQLGVLYDATHVWDAPQNRKQRIGPLVSLRLGGRFAGVWKPVLFASPLYYLEQPTRDSRVGAVLWLSFSLRR